MIVPIPGLERLLPRRGAPPARGVIIGAGGHGKTAALDELAARYETGGTDVIRVAGRALEAAEPFAALDRLVPVAPDSTPATMRAALLDRLGRGPWLLLVDDAHVLHPSTLAVLGGVADRAERAGGVVIAQRPCTDNAQVSTLAAALAAAGAAVHLGPWTGADVDAYLRTVAPLDDAGPAASLWEATDGVPAFIVAAATAAGDALPDAVTRRVQAELSQLGSEAASVAAALAAGVPLAAISAATGVPAPDIAGAAARLEHAGLLGQDRHHLPPIVRAAVEAVTPAPQWQRLNEQAAAALTAGGAPATAVADHLLAAGATGAEAMATLTEAAAARVVDDPAAARRWTDAALASDDRPPEALGLAAEAALRAGDVDAARRLADAALDGGDSGARAASVAAAIALSGGQTRRAAARWSAVAAAKGGAGRDRSAAAARAASLAATAGAVREADEALALATKLMPATPSVTLEAELLLAEGLVAAAVGDLDGGAETVGRAAAALAGFHPLGLDPPTVIAALLTAAAGHDDRAARFVSAPGRGHEAMQAWLKLRAGEIASAAAIASSLDEAGATRRDALTIAAVRVGIARRGTDLAALAAAWDAAAPLAETADADLIALPVLGELVAGAARAAPHEAATLARRWATVVEEAGGAPAWRSHLHWWEVQWAAAAGDAPAAATAAVALRSVVDAAGTFAVEADAAEAWAGVLAEQFDAVAVAATADALAAAGRAWEASVLAGAAALRTTEAGAARTLLGKGRDLRSRLAVTDTAATSDDSLSEREQEVAALVVEGLTHREIGSRLYISAKTVEHHVARIRQKLGASTRAEMLAAIRQSLDR